MLLQDAEPSTICEEVNRVFNLNYSDSLFTGIQKNFFLIDALFNGKFPGYKKCNTSYHDLDHTIEVFLATIRLIDGYNLKNKKIDAGLAHNLLNAALFHDVGYIQEEWDSDGTGAKHTTIHVKRSIELVEQLFYRFDLDDNNIPSIKRIIESTEYIKDFNSIQYISEEEKVAGAILGTADLIGQMANRNYLEKLLFLYYEFKEANIDGFNSEFDLVRKTIGFYEMTIKRFKESFMNIHEFAQDHFSQRFSIDANIYMDAIENNISYLKQIISDDTSNFRQKMKRMDLENSMQ